MREQQVEENVLCVCVVMCVLCCVCVWHEGGTSADTTDMPRVCVSGEVVKNKVIWGRLGELL